MVEEVRGEGSSSPNGNIYIKSIKRGTLERGEVSLSDGSSFFISAETVHRLSAESDHPLSKTLVEKLRSEDETFRALDKAYAILARFSQTEYHLRLKLKKRGFSENAISFSIGKLRNIGVLDDLAFAKRWVSSYVQRNSVGEKKLYAGLLRRGVPKAYAEEAIRSSLEPHVVEAALEKAYMRVLRRKGMNREQIFANLLRNGFSYAQVRDFVKNHAKMSILPEDDVFSRSV